MSRFDWSISILFSLVGTYASIGVNHERWVIESKLCIFSYFFNFFIFFRFFLIFIFVTSVPGWGYDWWKHINVDVTLPFWVIMPRDGGVWWIILQRKGDHIWSSGCAELFLPWVMLRRERHHDHIWISNFLLRQFRVVGLIPLYGIWAGSTHIWEPLSALGFLGAYNVSHPTTCTCIVSTVINCLTKI